MSRSLSRNEFTRVKIEDTNDYFFERFIFKHREDAAKRLADKLKFLVTAIMRSYYEGSRYADLLRGFFLDLLCFVSSYHMSANGI
jgi:hypothetical protein